MRSSSYRVSLLPMPPCFTLQSLVYCLLTLLYLPYSFVCLFLSSLTFIAGNVTTLSDGTPRLPPSTHSTGASPSNIMNQLPVLTPPDSLSTTISSATILTNSRPYTLRSPLGVPSITPPPVSVSQSTTPVITVVNANSNSLVSSALCDSSVPASATVVPSCLPYPLP